MSKTNPNNNRLRHIPPKMTPTTSTKTTSQNNTHKAMKGVLARFHGGPIFSIAQCVKNFIDSASAFWWRLIKHEANLKLFTANFPKCRSISSSTEFEFSLQTGHMTCLIFSVTVIRKSFGLENKIKIKGTRANCQLKRYEKNGSSGDAFDFFIQLLYKFTFYKVA